MGPRVVRLAVPFYAAFVLAAVVVSSLSGVGLEPGLSLLSLLAGPLAAAATVLSGVLAYGTIPAVRALADEVAPLLVEGASVRGLLLVALLSGVGEELLFRGALLPLLGVVPSSVLFGLLHVGPDRRYLLWTAWATAAGFLFAGLYLWTGGLLAPVVAHATHNGVTLLLWRSRWTRRRAAGLA